MIDTCLNDWHMSSQDCDSVPCSATSPGRQEGNRHELPVKMILLIELFSEKKHTGDWISILNPTLILLYLKSWSNPDPVHEELDPAGISFLPRGFLMVG